MPSSDSHQMPSALDAVTADNELENTLADLFGRAITTDCYENNEAVDAIFQAVQDGLLTPEEATDIILGKMLWR